MYQIDFDKPEHIHFIGIGGISMSGLAEILLDAGFTVSGSDAHETELTRHQRRGRGFITASGPPILNRSRGFRPWFTQRRSMATTRSLWQCGQRGFRSLPERSF